jgi:hypothetical protein
MGYPTAGVMAGRVKFVLVVVAVAVLATPTAATAAINSSPASSWQTNGRVRTIAVAAHKIFIGGDFTMVRAPGTASGGVARSHLAALSLTTGKLMPWNPKANGTVTALRVNPAGTTIYIGGGFTSVAGKARAHLAAVSTSETRLRKWTANTNGTVYAIATTAKRVYVGGSFTAVKGKTRHRLAALSSTSSATLQAWHPNPNSTVRALTLSPSGGRVFAGGDFTAVNGKTHLHLVALNTTAGGATPYGAHPAWPVTALRTTATALVVGGGGNGGHVAEYTSVNGSRKWLVVTDGDVQGLAILGSTIFVGGHFNNYCNGNAGTGTPLVCTTPTPRRKLLGLSIAKGTLGPWDPDVVGSTVGVSAVSAGGASVQAGGAFTRVKGIPQQGFARFK